MQVKIEFNTGVDIENYVNEIIHLFYDVECVKNIFICRPAPSDINTLKSLEQFLDVAEITIKEYDKKSYKLTK